MIATVTLNPSLDEHILVSGLMIEESNRWLGMRRYAGGKGIDVSRAIHEMNGSTVAYGFIGGGNGRLLEIMLDEEGVQYSFTPIAQETRANVIIADQSTGHQTRIGAPGPQITNRELERFGSKLRRVRPHPDLLAIGGSVPPGIPADIYYLLVNEARKVGVRTILDTAGHWLKEGIKANPYLIKPNVHEAEGLLVRDLPDEESIIEAALELVDRGIEIAVISRGSRGLIAASRETIIKAVPPKVDVVSTVGAGDCTIAGLALKLEHNEPLVEACQLAVAMGTAAVLTPGTELCRRDDVARLLPQVEVEQTSVSPGIKAFS